MRIDISQLLDFYNRPLGQAAARLVGERVVSLWPDTSGQDVLGLGYATPILDQLCGTPRRCIAAMPADQGGHRWPVEDGTMNLVTLTDDVRLPFRDDLFDRIVILHGLEETENAARYMSEVWRVCAPEGRVLSIVTSRRGLWARGDTTPFGHGRPFSRRQMTRILHDAGFQAAAWAHALYAPPMHWSLVTKAAEGWERAGELFWPQFGGVLMVEGVKKRVIDPNVGSPVRIVPALGRPGLVPNKARNSLPKNL